jgi:hypothetical protein
MAGCGEEEHVETALRHGPTSRQRAPNFGTYSAHTADDHRKQLDTTGQTTGLPTAFAVVRSPVCAGQPWCPRPGSYSIRTDSYPP